MRRDDIAVTGMGMVTPVGVGTEASWQGLLDGRSAAATDPRLDRLDVDFTCRVPGFEPGKLLGRALASRLDSHAHLALVAAREAVADAGLATEEWDATRVGVVLGVGCNSLEQYHREFGRLNSDRAKLISPRAIVRSVPNMVPAEVALDLGARGPSLAVSTACASGTTALSIARDLLRSGSCDIVLAGGSESGTAPVTVACFQQMRTLSERTHDPGGASRPFDQDRDGFVLGEGAGILVLERAEHAAARNARVHALLAGCGNSTDAHHVTAPHPEGRGAVQALRQALDDAGLTPADVDHVNAHGTSTALNDQAEHRALRAVFGTPPPVTANKSVLGHCLGGAGGIEAAATVLSLRHQTIPPTANLDTLDPDIDLDVVHKVPRPTRIRAALSNSFGFGGQNAVVVFTAV
ncbi:beta-ketoacyl-[acyl-carrier-protein] synthase family protein [Streptomyces benahoarensis]|uniref:Beta-ketoacyl-[acyl-carrier-protein] synthase family protein n=1 Tax=Streptomyces benahoarensis TaxID=2595054 RepID=A0A553YZC5_9ACTN|nr:beta-ketoacyl-[acyl-carrier-protein] synthase family protein [Streptomyces benahoarensis]TSB25611.1 beta-ketoacyl-[acyl-carrier-protein] synthase family protein [Streptomyces benahoarensis]TSB34575.1 beta-ketoacyl-[acyl-carrier-protein] synthase family protein [Streptomyces benahoarensis]